MKEAQQTEKFLNAAIFAEPHHRHVHHHRGADGRGHHAGAHPHHHLIHGGHPPLLLRGVLVHPPPLRYLLHWTRAPRFWVSGLTALSNAPRGLKSMLTLVGAPQADRARPDGC